MGAPGAYFKKKVERAGTIELFELAIEVMLEKEYVKVENCSGSDVLEANLERWINHPDQFSKNMGCDFKMHLIRKKLKSLKKSD